MHRLFADPSSHGSTLQTWYFAHPYSLLLHACSATRSLCRVCDGVPHVLPSTLHCAPVHVARCCHTSCSTAHCLGEVDWLTCRISSAATIAVISIGKPFLFGGRVYRSYWRACTSQLIRKRIRSVQARASPGTPSSRSPPRLDCRLLRYTSSRQCVSMKALIGCFLPVWHGRLGGVA